MSSSWADDWFETVPAGAGVSTTTRLRGDQQSLKELLLLLRKGWSPNGPMSCCWKDLVAALTGPAPHHPGPVYYYWMRQQQKQQQQQQNDDDAAEDHPKNPKNDEDGTSSSEYYDCCCVLGANPPDHCRYHLDLVVTTTSTSASQDAGGDSDDHPAPPSITTTTTTTTTLPMAGVDAEAIAGTLSLLLQWLATANKNSDTRNNDHSHYYDVTLKAFATQPRQPLPRLSLSQPLLSLSSSCIRALRLHFVAVATDTIATDFWKLVGPAHVELRQSTVQDWPGLFSQLEQINTQPPRRTTLTISCTLPEWVQWAPCTLPRNVQHLKLQLHFWLPPPHDDPVWTWFCEMLQHRAPNLQSLTLQYLEITDAAWEQLLTALHSHARLQSLTCHYTDQFVDAHRRLTPERRTARTRAVLALVQTTPRLRHVEWPSFQHDERVQWEIDAALAAAAAHPVHRPPDDDPRSGDCTTTTTSVGGTTNNMEAPHGAQRPHE